MSAASIARHHADWLQLVDVSGPFLTLPVLKRALPQGLNPTPPPKVEELRRAFQEFQDDRSLQGMWIRWVLTQLLELGTECLVDGPAIPASQTTLVAEHGLTLRPNILVVDPSAASPRMAVMTWPTGTELSSPVADSRWSASPLDRMAELLRATDLRLGLVTNGESWTLVHASPGEPTTFAGWDAAVWLEDRPTLDSFVTLLGVDRFFAVQSSDTLEALFTESANAEEEVTDQLGRQVRAAVELFVDALGRADREAGGRYLRGVEPDQIYLASVTVMMRLVFLLFAEERGLLLLGDPIYDTNYAAMTLRAQLQAEFDRSGSGPLERRSSAWDRLLATFRMVHGGVEHETLRLPGYGGSLFDPDRFPFLEGREGDTSYLEESGAPIPVDDHTILAMLDALQTLRFTDRGVTETRRLSFRELDVEQIGHVYEGLLDHTAVLTSDPAVGLAGKFEPEIALELIERSAGDGRSRLIEVLKEETGRTPKAIEKLLDAPCDADRYAKLLAACENDEELAKRIQPFHGLLRDDLRGLPTVYLAGSVYVTKSGERRSSGTYYTPRTLAEEMVRYALEPLVYSPGPQDGADPKDWELRSPAELLDLKVCDMAMGSGAFLVAATRYLSDRLVEAWAELGHGRFTPEGESTTDEVLVVPDQPAERLGLAHRLVAERCIYGVDKNPMAVEMAKLSMWLVTLAKDRPFSFLDHALKCGDSLLGVHDLAQIEFLHPDPERGKELHTTLEEHWHVWQGAVKEAIDRRRELESFTVLSVRDAELKRHLLNEAEAALDDLKIVADAVIGAATSAAAVNDKPDARLRALGSDVAAALDPDQPEAERVLRLDSLRSAAAYRLNEGRPAMQADREPFHWVLEFPEVFVDRGGFDAVISNPPYIGNKYWKERIGSDIQPFFSWLFDRSLGKPDVVVLFIWRMVLLSRDGGMVSSLATQSITEVDSKTLLQDRVLTQATISRAFRARPWPGTAAVFVSILWLVKVRWGGTLVLDDLQVSGIGADLREAFGDEPAELGDSLFAFQGVDNSRGMAFVVAAEDALCTHEDLVKPYVSGEDLTQSDPTRPSRWVLDLSGWSAADLSRLPPDVSVFLNDVVKPTRTESDLKSYKGLIARWWTFWNTREEGFGITRVHESCIVVPAVAKYLLALRLPSQWVYTNMVVVFDTERADVHALLLSACFDVWAKKYGGSLGAGRRMKVGPVVRTFPLPPTTADGSVARAWQDAALAALPEFGPGLNDVLNRVHDPSCYADGIVAVRAAYEEVHLTTTTAYGWEDLPTAFTFIETDEGVRWSLPADVRSELLRRLHSLNIEQRGSSADKRRRPARRSRGLPTMAHQTAIEEME